MPRKSPEPYIEPMPRSRRRSGHSSRRSSHGYEDHYYQQQIEQGVHNYDVMQPGLPMVPYGAGHIVQYGSDYSQPLNPYTGAIDPSYSQGIVPKPRNREDESWRSQKHRLGRRLSSDNSVPAAAGMASHPHYKPDPATIPYPALKPRPFVMVENTSFEPPPDAMEMVPYTDHQPCLRMSSFTEWIKDHIRGYHSPGRATDIATRLQDNVPDFASLLPECNYLWQNTNGKHPKPLRRLCHEGKNIEYLYKSLMTEYDGPFKPRKHCSSRDKAEAQQLFEDMFDRDFNKWDGFAWHVCYWLKVWYGKAAFRDG